MVHTLVATSDFRDDRDDIRADGEDGALGLGVAASRARAFRHARLAGRGPRSMPRSPTGSRSKSTLRPRARLCPRVPQAACGLKSNAVPLCDLDMPFHVCTATASTRAPRSPRPDPGRAVKPKTKPVRRGCTAGQRNLNETREGCPNRRMPDPDGGVTVRHGNGGAVQRAHQQSQATHAQSETYASTPQRQTSTPLGRPAPCGRLAIELPIHIPVAWVHRQLPQREREAIPARTIT